MRSTFVTGSRARRTMRFECAMRIIVMLLCRLDNVRRARLGARSAVMRRSARARSRILADLVGFVFQRPRSRGSHCKGGIADGSVGSGAAVVGFGRLWGAAAPTQAMAALERAVELSVDCPTR